MAAVGVPETPTADRLRKVFSQLEALVKQASADGGSEEEGELRNLLLGEFCRFFQVRVAEGAEKGSSGDASMWTSESAEGGGWALTNNSSTATMSACGSWRSLVSSLLLENEQNYWTFQIHAVRTVAIGITAEPQPEVYVGDSGVSWSYQSTGHMLHGGQVLDAHLAPPFAKGDRIGVLFDKKQRYIAFYKNGRMAGVPFVDIDTSSPYRMVVSCYQGPCSISVDTSPLGKKPMHNIMTFPIFIDEDRST